MLRCTNLFSKVDYSYLYFICYPSGADDVLPRAVDREFRTSDAAIVNVFTHRERRQIHDTLTNESHHEHLTVDINAFNKTFTLQLTLNRYVLISAMPDSALQGSKLHNKNFDLLAQRTAS
jgi:hypothetical protein